MDREERTAQQWLIMLADVLRPVAGAGYRLSTSLKLDEVTMLAAADEMGAATRDATAWVLANPCPDLELGGRVALLLKTCAEVALTAQRAITDPVTDIEAVVGRLRDLLATIDFQSQALDDWYYLAGSNAVPTPPGRATTCKSDNWEGHGPVGVFRVPLDPPRLVNVIPTLIRVGSLTAVSIPHLLAA